MSSKEHAGGLSRRAFLEESQSEGRKKFLENLQKGERRKGTVSSIVNFGAFVDLGGVDGLVHVSELSWKHVDHPGAVVAVGDKVTVQVLEVDGRAFDAFWHIDDEGLDHAIRATPQSRFRVAEEDERIAGYAVTGRAGEQGYLQRLAVDLT